MTDNEVLDALRRGLIDVEREMSEYEVDSSLSSRIMVDACNGTIETYKKCIKALEKTIATTPVWMNAKEVHKHKTGDKCAVCGHPIYYDKDMMYCPYCGQKLFED